MDRLDSTLATVMARRRLLGVVGATAVAGPLLAQTIADLRLPGGNAQRPLADGFPGKSGMILQRARPVLLETPLDVLGRDAITPNEQFFVRWHWQDFPTAIDVATFRLNIFGHVNRRLSVPLAALLKMPRAELVAVNQCSGNSRGFFTPRVPGAQWGHGAIGNARWVGVSLKHLLDLAGVKPGAVQVRFGGLDKPAPGGPDFVKALDLDHARDGEVMVAFQMNGAQLPLLNGFPLRLIVPGWFSTYWIKALSAIEVMPRVDDRYWMAKAYRIPATPGANVVPGAKDFPTEPINRMAPRSWITSIAESETIGWTPTIPLAGIAMGGDHGVARVDVSADGGRSWGAARLGPDLGRYGFRTWEAERPLARGRVTLMARCTSTAGVTQSMTPNWNPGGYLRCCIEPVAVTVA